jgi:hypothetical protein
MDWWEQVEDYRAKLTKLLGGNKKTKKGDVVEFDLERAYKEAIANGGLKAR